MAESTESQKKAKGEVSTEDGLLLYHQSLSFFSQKVVFALHEKGLSFRSHYMSLSDADHCKPWFLELNPKGQIPVLKDGVKVIPDSARIIDYLEDNFSNGDTPRLKPEKGSVSYKKMEHFIERFDTIQVPMITFGCIFHPEVTGKMKMSASERNTRTGMLPSLLEKLDELTAKNGELKDFYSKKKVDIRGLEATIMNIDNVKKAISDLGSVLEDAEKELATHDEEKEKWLCGEKFTVADITLAVILKRVDYLGLWNHYFGDSKLPKLNNYFKRVQLRDGFKKTMSHANIFSRICCLGTKEKLAVSLSSAVIILGVAGLALLIAQRRK